MQSPGCSSPKDIPPIHQQFFRAFYAISDMDGESLEDSAREMAELKGKLLEQQAAMREALSAMAVGFRRQLRQRHELQVQTEYFLATLQ